MRAKAVNLRHCGLIALGLLLWGRALAAGLEAILDRNRIAAGETVTLELTAFGDSGGDPDFSPLKADFDILNQGRSTRMAITNGQASSTREWQLVLAPKHSGKLTVPSVTVGGLSSKPLPIEVLPASQAAQLGQNRSVMIEVVADPKAPYVQGQVVYTVRLLYRVGLRQASLSDPSSDDAVVQKLGEDKRYSTYRNGERYHVIERRYVLFPQRSGSVTIEPPVLSASVPEQSGGRRPGLRNRLFGGGDPFGDFQQFFGHDPFAGMDSMFETTRPIQVRGRRITLDVKPQPATARSPWLPAESLQLSETWSPDPPGFRVGEPVTRTIAITAQGVSASQLPDLNPQVSDGIKVYPDKPQTQTRAEADDLVAMKVIKQALVPTQEGKLTLPEVRLPWWDTHTNQQRVAVLPAHTFDVLPARPGVAVDRPAQPAVPSTPPQSEPTGPAEAQAPSNAATAPAMNGKEAGGQGRPRGGSWPWIALVLGLVWLATIGLWLRDRARLSTTQVIRAAASADTDAARPNLGEARTQVRQALDQGNPRAAREALLVWAAARWPKDPPRRLETMSPRLGGAAADALRDLDRHLYGSAGSGWNGSVAWSRIGPALAVKGDRAMGEKAADQPLPELYPGA
jgi:hypothetical protein